MAEEIQPESENRSKASQRLDSMGRRLFQYIEFDEDEEFLYEIRKHPIGLFFTWMAGGFITAIIIMVTLILSMSTDDIANAAQTSSSESLNATILFAGLVVTFISLSVTIISAWLYVSNVIFVTSEKIAEVRYHSIFNRQVTQLNIGKVEDVTVTQVGILPRVFKYGSLLVETAGETPSPYFTYVPQPYEVSKIILQAHENYVEKYGN